MPGLFAPTIVVNNATVAIKPNSFSYKEGFGERNVRVASTGGGGRSIVTTENVETQMGSCKFTLYTTADNIAAVRSWLANGSANMVEASDRSGWSRTFQQAIITNDPDLNLGVDGEIEVEFMSNPAV